MNSRGYKTSLVTLSNEERQWIIDFLTRAWRVEIDQEALTKAFEKIRGKTFAQATTMLGALAGDVTYDIARLKYKKILPYTLVSLIYVAILTALDEYVEKVGIEEKEKEKFISNEFNNLIKSLGQLGAMSQEEYGMFRLTYIEVENEYKDLAQVVQQEASDICGQEPFAQALCSYTLTAILLKNVALEAYEALKVEGLVKFMTYIIYAASEHIMDRIDTDSDKELALIYEEFINKADLVFEATWDFIRISLGKGLITFEETLSQEYQEEEAMRAQVSDEALSYYNMALEQLAGAYMLIASAAKRLKTMGVVLLAIPIALGVGFFIYFVSTNPYVDVKMYLQNPGLLIWHLFLAIFIGPILINFLLIIMGLAFVIWSLKLRGSAKTIGDNVVTLKTMSGRFDPVKVQATINDLMTMSVNPNVPFFVKAKCIEAVDRIELALNYLRKFVELLEKS